jgi:hypothetical protein
MKPEVMVAVAVALLCELDCQCNIKKDIFEMEIK